MQVIAEAGTYTPPDGAGPNHWIVHLSSADLSLGTYSIPAGGQDDQSPHTEDEVYVVRSGRDRVGAQAQVGAVQVDDPVVGPGAVGRRVGPGFRDDLHGDLRQRWRTSV